MGTLFLCVYRTNHFTFARQHQEYYSAPIIFKELLIKSTSMAWVGSGCNFLPNSWTLCFEGKRFPMLVHVQGAGGEGYPRITKFSKL